MRRIVTGLALVSMLVVALSGCAEPDEKAIVTLTDEEGVVETRVVTVGYVNERLEHMPPTMLPGGEGDEAKLAFLNEIVRKELLVIAGYRLGVDKDPRIAGMLESVRASEADNMLRRDLITEPSQVSTEEVEDYYTYRDASFQNREIVLNDEELANEVFGRVTDGGEDFATVAAEVSTASSSADGGRRAVQEWVDMHPLIRNAIKHSEAGDIVGPIEIAQTWHILEIISRKLPLDREPLEGQHLAGITMECQNFKRDLRENEVIQSWLDAADITYSPEAEELAGTRIDEQVALLILPFEGEMTTEIAIARAKTKIVPQFSEEEAAMEFVRYNVGGEAIVWTLGDYARVLDESPGIETPKQGSALYVEDSVQKRVFKMLRAYEIEKRGYHTSGEMEGYIAARLEEAIVDLTYDAEIQQKVVRPPGDEVVDYFNANRDKFVRPPRADVRQLVVGEEAQANLLRQQIIEGGADFVDVIREHSIEDWSKSRDGVIKSIFQGEARLSYLQEPAFSLEVGELSQPIRAPGGYALVVVLERYPEEQLTGDQVGDGVVERMVAELREARLVEFLDQVKESVNVTIHEENLGLMTDPALSRDKMQTVSFNVGT